MESDRNSTSSTVLVTGGNGLVGSALRWAVTESKSTYGPQRNETWVFLRRADGDLRDLQQTMRIFQKYRPTYVIHLAARVGGVYDNSLHHADFVRDNVAMDQNVLRLCHETSVRTLVSCLSTCIFPDNTTYPIKESMLHDGPPHPSNFGYAHAKRMLDISNRAYRAQFGCNFTAVIPTNIYGPNDNFGDGGHFIPSIIKRVDDAASIAAKGIVIPGSGRALRQFIYSRDLARLILRLLHTEAFEDPIILSVDADTEISVHDVVELTCKLSGWTGSLVWDRSKPDGQLRKTVDNAKMKELVPNFEFTPFEQAMTETIGWYRENKHKARL